MIPPITVHSEAELVGLLSECATRAGKRPLDVSLADMRKLMGVPEKQAGKWGAWPEFKIRHFRGEVPDVWAGDRPVEDPDEADRLHVEPGMVVEDGQRKQRVWRGDRPDLGAVEGPEMDDDATDPGDSGPGLKILVIPDAHAHPDYDNDRFEALGNLIAHERPDVVVSIGDWADMPSLSSHDKGSRGFEGRRYKRDIHSAVDAQRRMFGQVPARDRIRWVKCVGNHEHRIDRATQKDSEYDGAIGVGDLGYSELWDEVVPYREHTEISGILFSHCFENSAGRVISGVYTANTMIRELKISAVAGHNHRLMYYDDARKDGSRIFGLTVGYYGHPDHMEGWSKGFDWKWWRGVVVLDGAQRGEADVRTIDQRRILSEYL